MAKPKTWVAGNRPVCKPAIENHFISKLQADIQNCNDIPKDIAHEEETCDCLSGKALKKNFKFQCYRYLKKIVYNVMYYGPLSVLLVGGRLSLAWRSTSEDQSKCLSLALLCSWQQVSPMIFLQFLPQNFRVFIFRFVSRRALRIKSVNLEPPEPQKYTP